MPHLNVGSIFPSINVTSNEAPTINTDRLKIVNLLKTIHQEETQYNPKKKIPGCIASANILLRLPPTCKSHNFYSNRVTTSPILLSREFHLATRRKIKLEREIIMVFNGSSQRVGCAISTCSRFTARSIMVDRGRIDPRQNISWNIDLLGIWFFRNSREVPFEFECTCC